MLLNSLLFARPLTSSNTTALMHHQGRRLVTASLDGTMKFFYRSAGGCIPSILWCISHCSCRMCPRPRISCCAPSEHPGQWTEEDHSKSAAPTGRSHHLLPSYITPLPPALFVRPRLQQAALISTPSIALHGHTLNLARLWPRVQTTKRLVFRGL